MVRRAAVLCGLVASALAVALAPVAASAPPEVGPPCADFSGLGGFAYVDGVVGGSADIAAPACRNVTYTLYVLSGPDGTLIGTSSTSTYLASLGRISWTGFNVIDPDGDGSVCVYAETTAPGGKVFDRAPDTGCVTVSGPPGPGSFL